ncbi:hypothetical protein [Neorhodopirellula pilleata]|uniref:HAMP domain-containing protein n=1 Tax=Neorhodopirellula pilleata TaxID=2714738 RepID=A0A5C6ADB9_9BACT|nr:hypothetical protein [Neorhodopirellula pilleata]TWT97430.1 hypothetical protein Pla100_25820 [Neorhodopirellula pilleata]
MSKRPIREQLLVEQDVQLSLILRAVLYGAACMTYFTVIQFFTKSSSHPETATWETVLLLTDEAIYWVPGFFMLGPLMIYDMLRITNRVAGPIFAMRRQMMAINQGDEGRQLKFRNEDYWDSLASEFNAVREEIIRLRCENKRLQSEATAASNLIQDKLESESLDDSVVPR